MGKFDFDFGGIPIRIPFKEQKIFTTRCSNIFSFFMILLVVSFSAYTFNSWYNASERVFETERKLLNRDHDFHSEGISLYKQINLTFSTYSGLWAFKPAGVTCDFPLNESTHHQPSDLWNKTLYPPGGELPLKLYNFRLDCSVEEVVNIDPDSHRNKNNLLKDSWACENHKDRGAFQRKLSFGEITIQLKTANWESYWHLDNLTPVVDHFYSWRGRRELFRNYIPNDSPYGIPDSDLPTTTEADEYGGLTYIDSIATNLDLSTIYMGEFGVRTVLLDSSNTGYKEIDEQFRVYDTYTTFSTSDIQYEFQWERIDVIEHDKYFGSISSQTTVYQLYSSQKRYSETIDTAWEHNVGFKNYLRTSFLEYHVYPTNVFVALGRVGGVASVILAAAVLLRMYNGMHLDEQLKSQKALTFENLQEIFEHIELVKESDDAAENHATESCSSYTHHVYHYTGSHDEFIDE